VKAYCSAGFKFKYEKPDAPDTVQAAEELVLPKTRDPLASAPKVCGRTATAVLSEAPIEVLPEAPIGVLVRELPAARLP